MTDARKLSAYVEPHLSERETAEQWLAIEERLGGAGPVRGTRPRGLRLAATFAVVGAIVAASVMGVTSTGIWRKTPVTSAWDGAALDSGRDGVSVSLGDGSHIDLEPDSRILVREGTAHAVRLDMPRGGAHFDVPHVEGRSFEVLADGVRVRVVGTRFSVTRAPAPGGHRITVAVERGAVLAEPEAGGEPMRVAARETWSALRLDAARARMEPPSAPGASAASSSAETASSAAPGSPSAIAELEAPAASTAPTRAASRATPEDTAQELFERGNAARQAGDARGAAAAYEALLRRHPSDARAGLSAFELGRLRMDQLGDLRGAVTALGRAVALAPGPGFREDALARLVRAYGTLGRRTRCEEAQKQYLGSYPGGVHAAAVQNGCGHGP